RGALAAQELGRASAISRLRRDADVTGRHQLALDPALGRAGTEDLRRHAAVAILFAAPEHDRLAGHEHVQALLRSRCERIRSRNFDARQADLTPIFENKGAPVANAGRAPGRYGRRTTCGRRNGVLRTGGYRPQCNREAKEAGYAPRVLPPRPRGHDLT